MKTLKKTTFFKILFIGLVFTLLGCTEENNYYTTADGLGKVNVYIEGNITDAECAAKLKAEVGSITENIYVGGTDHPLTNLTTLELNVPKNVRYIRFYNGYGYDKLKNITIRGQGAMPQCNLQFFTGPKTENVIIEGFTELFEVVIQSFSEQEQPATIICKDLIYVQRNFSAGGGISTQVNGGGVANTLICNDLKYVDPDYNYQGSGAGFWGIFNSFSVNSLKKVGGGLYLGIGGGGSVTDITFPALEEIGTMGISKPSFDWEQGLNSINFPILNKSYGMNVSDDLLGTLNLPALTYCKTVILKDQVLPSTIVNMPVLNYCISYTSNIKLTSVGVNAVLNKFLTIQPSSGKYIDLTQEVSPLGQGLIDKQTLITQGNQVYTN